MSKEDSMEDELPRELLEMFAEWEDDFRATVPSRFKGCTLHTYDTPTVDNEITVNAVQAWASHAALGAPGLFLYGPPGTGKTHLSVAAACLLVRAHGYRAKFINLQAYLEKRRESFNGGPQRMDPRRLVSHYKMLVLDDLGVEKPSEWVREQVFAIVDAAYNDEILTIANSNLSYAELARPDMLGERTVSRLIEMTDKVMAGGKDYRQKRQRSKGKK